jgi:peptidoglycan/LPS O-acetylase OafA/YrhL
MPNAIDVQEDRELKTKVAPRSNPPGDARVPELDGIRAIAIWMVLVHHVFFAFPRASSAYEGIPVVLLRLVDHGWLGVDLFFILSGFLITGILIESKSKPNYAKNFYMRRVLRIFPLYFVAVVTMWLFYPDSTSYLLLSFVFLANFANGFQIHEPHGMGILWSLNIEEHFYLAWPWVVFCLGKRKLAYLAASIVVLTPFIRGFSAANGMNLLHIYSYSWFRFDGLAVGALIAIWVRSSYCSRRNTLALAMAVLAAGLVITAIGMPFGLMEKGTAGAALRYTQAQTVFAAGMLAVLALLNTPFTAILRSRFARLTGELSYCLYLVHLAIGDAYVTLTNHYRVNLEPHLGTFGAVLFRAAVIATVSYLVALASRKYLERPILRWKVLFQ